MKQMSCQWLIIKASSLKKPLKIDEIKKVVSRIEFRISIENNINDFNLKRKELWRRDPLM